jgi:hypothetical protein
MSRMLILLLVCFVIGCGPQKKCVGGIMCLEVARGAEEVEANVILEGRNCVFVADRYDHFRVIYSSNNTVYIVSKDRFDTKSCNMRILYLSPDSLDVSHFHVMRNGGFYRKPGVMSIYYHGSYDLLIEDT